MANPRSESTAQIQHDLQRNQGRGKFYKNDILRLYPQAKAQDFYPNGMILSDATIRAIENEFAMQALQETEDARYSKKYLQDELKLDIERGGILRIKDASNEFVLYAVYKTIQSDNEEKQIKNKAIKIGEGSYGKVKLIQNLKTGEFFAMKILFPETESEEVKKNLERQFKVEAKCVAEMQRGHGHVLYKKRAGDEQGPKKLCIVEDIVPGKTLFDVLVDEDEVYDLTAAARFTILLQAFRAIKEMHEHEWLHRDIKLDNFMCYIDPASKKITVSVVDFGSAGNLQTANDDGIIADSEEWGISRYEAPETVSYQYSKQSDIYSLGCVVGDVFGVQQDEDLGDLNDEAAQEDLSGEEIRALKDLASNMLKEERIKRCSLDQAIKALQEIRDQYVKRKEYESDQKKRKAENVQPDLSQVKRQKQKDEKEKNTSIAPASKTSPKRP
ncbi:MAG: hypothetical protein ACD_45C00180G0001 [uncultured bacterium]|nr:MAG: hypothetical protein ACD_45C00180G0001 [uncultured bacterium]